DSGEFTGLNSKEAREKMTIWLEKNNLGGKKVNYKLKDWVFSRQRYWGEPMPLVHCKECEERIKRFIEEEKIDLEKAKREGISNFQFPISKQKIENSEFKDGKIDLSLGELLNPGWIADDKLPLELPDVDHYEPSGTGESPLANIEEWVNTKCPKCGGKAERETNTMPQWAGSSWYYLRYIDPKNSEALVDKEKEKYWSPVDFYVGGAEHATRHLIYARFWHKFLYDIGVVNYEEPFTRLQHVGLIMAEDGRKMSKRFGNVINPDDIVEDFGADSLRVYEMFMGPFSQSCAWSTNGAAGVRRFLEKVWNIFQDKELFECGQGKCGDIPKELPPILHKTIKKVTEDIESFDFNTAVSQMMIFINEFSKYEKLPKAAMERFLILLSPFAPHIAEEIWSEVLGNKKSIFLSEWPKFDPEKIKDENIEMPVQVNGKVRDKINVTSDISEEEAKKIALESEKVKKYMESKEPKKVIFVKGRLISIVI
ncbi:MAG: class I tRNA ligase family protein, partial [Candidatus Moranbacteria bacterium]|nr:class I tRNA ligase family protein [Candidatus Moranbacteria bacterium]